MNRITCMKKSFIYFFFCSFSLLVLWFATFFALSCMLCSFIPTSIKKCPLLFSKFTVFLAPYVFFHFLLFFTFYLFLCYLRLSSILLFFLLFTLPIFSFPISSSFFYFFLPFFFLLLFSLLLLFLRWSCICQSENIFIKFSNDVQEYS